MSKYSIITANADGSTTEIATRSEKDAAIKLADAHHAENAGMLTVVVKTEAGTVVHEQLAVSDDVLEDELEGTTADDEETEVETSNRHKPWSRVATPRGWEAPEVEGYTLAYTRSRIKTGIYRADDKSGWLVLDTRTDTRTEHENTKTARVKTNELSAAYSVEAAQARQDRKDAKAREVQAKKAERDSTKATKAAAKAEAKAAKEAAKAEAEAAKEAATTVAA